MSVSPAAGQHDVKCLSIKKHGDSTRSRDFYEITRFLRDLGESTKFSEIRARHEMGGELVEIMNFKSDLENRENREYKSC